MRNIFLLGLLFTVSAYSQGVTPRPGGAPNYKGLVASTAALPSIGNSPGDMRIDLTLFHEYIWNGSSWVDVTGSGAGGIVSSFNTRTGAVTLTSGDVLTALGFTPENVANKSTDGTMTADSTTLYPSQSAVVTYVGSQIAAIPTPTPFNGVSSVSNSDGTLIISPTTGAVVASRPAITGDISIPATSNISSLTATTNSTLTTLSALALPYSQLTGSIPTWNQNTTGTASNITATTNSTLTSLPNLVVTNAQALAAIGFTPENVANKSTDGTMAADSTTLYPTQSAVVTYTASQIAAIPTPTPSVYFNINGLENVNSGSGAGVNQYTTGGTEWTISADNINNGFQAGNSQTTAFDTTNIGAYAGWSNTTSGDNTNIGQSAGYDNIGPGSTYIGGWAGYWQGGTGANPDVGTTGMTCIGFNACESYTAGMTPQAAYNDTFVGVYSGSYLTSGYFNAVFGSDAGYKLTSGYENAFMGGYSGNASTTAHYNSMTGYASLWKNTTGVGNSGTGYYALANVTGSYNIGLGINSGNGDTNVSNTVYIGSQTASQGANTIQIDSSNADGANFTKPMQFSGTIYYPNLTASVPMILNSSKAVVSGSQTGTGTVFVMQASPTLTTPVIGAATGTSLSVTGQLTSTVATGTAPLAVTSTTQVANLNAATAGTATNSTNAAVTTESGNTNYYLTFVGANSTSNQGIDVGPATYNPSTGSLTATTFVGALTGHASSDLALTGGTLSGNLTLGSEGHLISTGTAPTTTVNANAGTGATCTLTTATDVKGQITLTTGSGSWASGNQCAINFNTSYGATPICVITPLDSTTDSLVMNFHPVASTAALNISFDSADLAATTYNWAYHCIQ